MRFDPAVRALVRDGHTTFVESSPHPVLVHGLQEILDDLDTTGTVLGTVRRDVAGQDQSQAGGGGLGQFQAALAGAHCAGVRVDLARTAPEGRWTELPTYTFDRSRYWMDTPAAAPPAAPGVGVDLPSGQVVFAGAFSAGRQPWLTDHAVNGAALVPATALLDLVAGAGAELGLDLVEELTHLAPMPVTAQTEVRVIVEPADADGRRAFAISARPTGGDWTRAASGVLATGGDAPAAEPWPADLSPVDITDAYGRLGARGYGYGLAFAGLRSMWTGPDAIFAEVELPAGPARLDAALHPALLRLDGLRLPFAWREVRLTPSAATTLRVRLTVDGDEVALVATDPGGHRGAAGRLAAAAAGGRGGRVGPGRPLRGGLAPDRAAGGPARRGALRPRPGRAGRRAGGRPAAVVLSGRW